MVFLRKTAGGRAVVNLRRGGGSGQRRHGGAAAALVAWGGGGGVGCRGGYKGGGERRLGGGVGLGRRVLPGLGNRGGLLGRPARLGPWPSRARGLVFFFFLNNFIATKKILEK